MKVQLCALMLSLTLLTPLMATAQDAWRCGPDGRVYSDTPCADGRRVDLSPARPAEDVQEARRQAAQETRLAQELRRERLAAEAVQRGNGVGALGPVATVIKTPKPASPKELSRSRTKPRGHQADREADGTWRAVAPVSRRGRG